MSSFPPNPSTSVQSAAEIIRKSKRGVVLSGAGISTASGIPDFRSPQTGLWSKIEPLEVASALSFRYDPLRFFDWLRPLAIQVLNAKPNPAHMAVHQLQQMGYIHTIITQNIDGLHQKAGSKNVIEVHGTLETMTCVQCFVKVSSQPYLQPYIEQGSIPRCPHCEGILKPDVILFGEQMPYQPWLRAQKASRQCDLMIVAGSSLEVLPVAKLPMEAIERGAHLIIINHTPTYLDVRADVVFSEDVSVVLPEIVARLVALSRS
ncbi:MAG: NAD-dependent deacylase [Anaerolineales bacterium]|nr:NAD-dependent deacylase [Anaerolineales bacterium]MCS7247992.1 NAD-dependent deacylase [Anaerolineales bacterium]MDW8161804.1 NAD-dependent deacylase [Anaerolineales bacterium]MDW8446501.1 NAD-dependent deacylase [Anaerolineales bacterium]